MAEEALAKSGLHLDSFNKIRLLQTDLAESGNELCDEVKEFRNKVNAFQSSTDGLMETLKEFTKMVDSEKLRTMSSRNALKAADKQKIADAQQLQILIRERRIELERLRVEYEAAQKEENEQKEYLQKFLSPT
ncbi:Intraflagellar transport protein 20 -like protein [Toxocara canis]|uniref:Intraflagellar transport protein 20-like protein n=1 Tax=Toxocara canis TaxID=6265 RepID=A0A0B2VTZ7_TOXCA|nr:Intraflagellar transport protein 20 -like protein [Toxocara canis]